MKIIRSFLLFGMGLVLSFNLVHAEQPAFSSSNVSLDSVTDLQTLLEAIESVPPVPFNATSKQQKLGTFWSAQHPPGSSAAWPPLPGNVLGLSIWPMGDGHFILDDRQVDYFQIQAAAEAEAALTAAASPRRRTSMMASSLPSSYAYGNPVYLTNLVVSSTGYQPMTASFSIAGGTNFVPYDILMTTNVATSVSQWNWLGTGYTANNYTFNSQPVSQAFYILAKPQKTMVAAWGENYFNQCDVPSGITNAVMVAGGGGYTMALLNSGTVIGWGGRTTEGSVPTNLTGVAMIASGINHKVVLLTNGTVLAWGDNLFGETSVPANLTNATVISAQLLHTLALRADGTVVSWGDIDSISGLNDVPTGLTNIVAIAAGGDFNLVAKADGTVVAWGDDYFGECDVPTGLSNVWDVAAGDAHSVALKKDGTVVAWGDNTYGETTVPAALSNVVAIAACGYPYYCGYTLALKKDGTVVAWGKNKATASVGGLTNVIAIGAEYDSGLAIRSGPPTPVITLEPTDQYQVGGGSVTFTAKGVGLYGVTYQWQTNGVNLLGATNAALMLTNVQAAQIGSYDAVVSGNGGTGSIVSSNANFYLVTPLVIISQTLPTNQIVFYQSNLTLSVTATAPGQFNGFPVGYQWQFNGANIAGANTASYSFNANNGSAGTYSVIVTNAVGGTNVFWQMTINYSGSYIDVGTLAYHLSTNAVGHTNGFVGSYNDMVEYSAPSSTNLDRLTNAVWSTNFWLKGVQGLSANTIGYSNVLGGQGLITMVSPRHYLLATHMHPEGYMIAFLDTNNVVYWRTTLQRIDVTNTAANDTSVGILNADLPPSVGFLPIVPTNLSSYLPENGSSNVQGIGMNQQFRLFSQPMTFGTNYVSWNNSSMAPFGLPINWDVLIVPGDSSAPEMFLISNQLVLASHNYSAGVGPNYASQLAAINQQMHYLSTNNAVTNTDYQLTIFSMTNWPVIH